MKKGILTLLVLTLGGLACTMQIPTNSLGTVPIPTTNALGSTEKPVTTPSALGKPELATVTAYQSLHVRAARGVRAIVIGYLYNGNTVTLTGRCDQGWAEIVWTYSPSGTAWVNADFLSENKCSEEE